MPKLSDETIYQLAYTVLTEYGTIKDFKKRQNAAIIATAIALGESGGDPAAVNKNANGSTDRGLWQINSIHGALSTHEQIGNARAMAKISKGGTYWVPWVVYKTGTYRTYMPRARAVAKGHTSGGFIGGTVEEVGGIPGVGNPLEDIAASVENIGKLVGALLDPRTWIRIAQIIGGGILIILGLLTLLSEKTPMPIMPVRRLVKR